MLEGLPAVLQRLTPDLLDDWSLAAWLIEPRTELAGLSPVECLREDERTNELKKLVDDLVNRLQR